jgi:homoserine dehydrogenase
MLAHRVQERHMNAAIARIEALPSIRGAVTRIRREALAG